MSKIYSVGHMSQEHFKLVCAFHFKPVVPKLIFEWDGDIGDWVMIHNGETRAPEKVRSKARAPYYWVNDTGPNE